MQLLIAVDEAASPPASVSSRFSSYAAFSLRDAAYLAACPYAAAFPAAA